MVVELIPLPPVASNTKDSVGRLRSQQHIGAMNLFLKAIHSLRLSKQFNQAGSKTSFFERCHGDTHAHAPGVRSLSYRP